MSVSSQVEEVSMDDNRMKDKRISEITVHPSLILSRITDTVDVKVRRIMEKIKQRRKKETKPVPAMCMEERSLLRSEEFKASEPDHRNITSSFPTLYACKSALYRQRETEIPKLPIASQDIVLEGLWTRTTLETTSLWQTTVHIQTRE